MTELRPKTGDTAPEIDVLDASGNAFRLSDKTGSDKNTMILFYRGHW